jgi:hypothetical protein
MKAHCIKRTVCYTILFGKCEWQKTLAKTRSGWNDNIKIHLRKTEGEGALKSCSSKQGTLAGSCERRNEKAREFLTS